MEKKLKAVYNAKSFKVKRLLTDDEAAKLGGENWFPWSPKEDQPKAQMVIDRRPNGQFVLFKLGF